MTLVVLFVLFALLPLSWTKRVWSFLVHRVYRDSALRVGVDKVVSKIKEIRNSKKENVK